MNTKKGIYWLASYPKSGNTWFRIFLANLLNKSNAPVDLNAIHTGAIASSREWVDHALGFDSAYLSHDELDNLRPSIYTHYHESSDKTHYHKIHDAYVYTPNQQTLIPASDCLGALYFIRNPLDVAISFANHLNCNIDESILMMNDMQYAFCKSSSRQFNQLRQPLLSWSAHVKSWVNANNLRVLVLRYEDMKLQPQDTFTRATLFLQLEESSEKIAEALALAHIDKLQLQEAESGFNEKPLNATCFFRKGIAGDWQNTLNDKQIERIIHDHRDVMEQFGYVDAQGTPIEYLQQPVTSTLC